MTAPSLVEHDKNAPRVSSPVTDYASGGGEAGWRNDQRRRSSKQAVDLIKYRVLRTKYLEARKRMERMEEESTYNKRNKQMLLEMSSVICALKNISVDYDYDTSASRTPITNVQKKIQALDGHLKSVMMQCDTLEEEKKVHMSTIQAQEGQIRTMEQQIAELEKKLEESMMEERKAITSEEETLDRMNREGEMASTVKAQEEKIAALEAQLRKMASKKSSTVCRKIKTYRGAHEARYQEIDAMEEKLAMLRKAQTNQSVAKTSNRNKPAKQVSFVPVAVVHQLDRKEVTSSS